MPVEMSGNEKFLSLNLGISLLGIRNIIKKINPIPSLANVIINSSTSMFLTKIPTEPRSIVEITADKYPIVFELDIFITRIS